MYLSNSVGVRFTSLHLLGHKVTFELVHDTFSAAGLTPYEPDTPPQSPKLTTAETALPISRQAKPAKLISYDDYHILWKGIATSVSEYKHNNDRKLINDMSVTPNKSTTVTLLHVL